MGRKDNLETATSDISSSTNYIEINFQHCDDSPCPIVARCCQCSQLHEGDATSYPSYKDFPPPEPPDGRADLWDLQFCRWWGWNWVKKQEAGKEERKFSSKYSKKIEDSCQKMGGAEKECQSMCAKKAVFSHHEPVVSNYEQVPLPLTVREQFKAMCRCLLGKKKTPSCMIKMYNTPSATSACSKPGISVEKKMRKERRSCSKELAEKKKQVERRHSPEKHHRSERRRDCDEPNCEKRVPRREKCTTKRNCKETGRQCRSPKQTKDSAVIEREEEEIQSEVSRDDTPYESAGPSHRTDERHRQSSGQYHRKELRHREHEPRKRDSSTEESIEYINVRLQHLRSDCAINCKKYSQPPLKEHQEETVTAKEAYRMKEPVRLRPCKGEQVQAVVPCVEQCTVTSTEKNNMEQSTSYCVQNNIVEESTSYYVENSRVEESTSDRLSKDTKETQTYHIEEDNKSCGTCSEKLLKLKGKKHKTICIMVCCCNTCKGKNPQQTVQVQSSECKEINQQPIAQNQQPTNQSDQTQTNGPCNCKGKGRTKDCAARSSLPLTDQQESLNRLLSNNPDFQTTEDVAYTYALSSKTLSKFGTPSKFYPWMHATESTMTTTSLNNIRNYPHVFADPSFQRIQNDDDMKMPAANFVGINEDLALLSSLDLKGKISTEEDRLLLDAVCDAILQRHEEKECDYWKGFDFDDFDKNDEILETAEEKSGELWKEVRFNTTEEFDTKELGILCNFTDNTTVDVYTELSKVLVNTEDVGIQIKDTPEPTDTEIDSFLDTFVNDILKDPNPYGTVVDKLEQYERTISVPNRSNQLIPPYPSFTKTGLIPAQASICFRSPPKRTSSEKDNNNIECKKRIKEEQEEGDRIGNIFSRIDDIVSKSKVKTAEIHKVLSLVPKNNAQNEVKPCHIGTCKRTYPMSSDTFRSLVKRFNNQASCVSRSEEVIVQSGNDSNENDQKTVQDGDSVKNISEKLSKLSVHSFLVCDEKSMVELKPSVLDENTMRSVRKAVKKKGANNCKAPCSASLIPVRKRSKTDNNL